MKKYLWIIFSILFVIFISLIYLVVTSKITTFDLNCYSFISKYITKDRTSIIKVLTRLGSWYSLILISVFGLLLLKDNDTKISIPINLTCAFLINCIVKNIIRRPRPNVLRLVTEKSFSFPSGHSMVSTAFYGYLIYLIYKKVNNKTLKYCLMGLLSLLIIIICLSRVYLGAHYMSDVLGGFIFACCYLILFINIIKKFHWKNPKTKIYLFK